MTHDLTFVAPDRRDEVRRRIAAVENFIAAPGRAAAAAAAGALGLHTAQFYNLVRAWRETGRPESIVGRSGPRTAQPRIERPVLDLIERVIAEDGRATTNDIIDRVRAAALSSDVTLPDHSTIGRHVRRKRPALLADDVRAAFDIVVDHTVIDLPVDFGNGRVLRPLATLAIDVTTDAIVGLALSAATPTPAATASALLDTMRRGIRNGHPPDVSPRIGIVAVSPEEAHDVIDALRRCGLDATVRPSNRHGGGLIAESLLGRSHAGLQFKQRLVWHKGSRRSAPLTPGSAALSPIDADTLARGRLMMARSTMIFAGIDDVSRSRLAVELAALVQAG